MFHWIDIYAREEQRERDQLDQRIDCLTTEAFRAYDAGMMGQFNALVIEIATLNGEIDHPFSLELIF